MIHVVLILLIVSACFVAAEVKIVRMIISLGIFSLISSVCFLLLSSPDVAMAEAAVSSFSTIIFIVTLEKYFSLSDPSLIKKKTANIIEYIPPFVFAVFLLILFIWFMPDDAVNTYLKDMYTDSFMRDVGGENSVTAIYLGYRMYDTLFEALMLFVSVIAIMHLSWHEDAFASDGKRSDIRKLDIAYHTIRMVSPVLILFGIYLIMNGHISPGGGFQGGALIASFFTVRYMIHDIYDINIGRAIIAEKLIYVGIILLAAFFIFNGAYAYLAIPKSIYLITMNFLIGMKVTCGFLIIFYRFIALERR